MNYASLSLGTSTGRFQTLRHERHSWPRSLASLAPFSLLRAAPRIAGAMATWPQCKSWSHGLDVWKKNITQRHGSTCTGWSTRTVDGGTAMPQAACSARPLFTDLGPLAVSTCDDLRQRVGGPAAVPADLVISCHIMSYPK